jgi:uncharacterized protein (TIGR02594 family)
MLKYIVTATALRVRSGPGTTYAIVTTIIKDMIVQGGEIKGDWVNVTTPDNKTGWSHRGYLKLMDESPPLPSTETAYRVDATTLNLRKGPGTGYSVIGTLKLGEFVAGISISADSQWAQVRKSNGIVGWSSLKYMTRLTPLPPPSESDIQMFVASDVLIYRSGPSEAYPIIGQLVKGTAVTYLNATPDWRWVNFRTPDNQSGWAYSKFLTESNDLFAPREDYLARGLHRALSDVIPMRAEPNETSAEIAPVKFNRVLKVDSITADGKWKHCTNAWGEQGWYPIERLSKLPEEIVTQRAKEEYPWLAIAYAEFGTRETPGAKHNPRIVEYLMSTDLAQKYSSLPDETDWCSGFVNWCIEKVKIPSTNSAVVNPWRSWGKASNPPRRGAVTTFLWDDGWAHVSFYLGEVGNYVICLGGNQSDAVWISVYHKKYVTSYRIY